MKVRSLNADDSPALVPLLDQLGYPSSEQAIRDRLEFLLSDSTVGCWVAEDDAGLAGLLTGQLSRSIETDGPAARLTALVVDSRARGQGTARLLTAAFEDWARNNGAAKAGLSSNTSRLDAHAAYRKLGWTSTALGFTKELSKPDAR
ncbi:GNAT family N-acetyltransferase [Curtobacterium sp. MCSS17_008]|uniref:GNAT family N-acetyltransferase n=1 Tax=Curtobacterium sp. MCSS17_008 TaxID=2175647 RepID=UPI000DAA7439|nr:GNAT family N-acetyltransferase [Curtobacterium sp. MCSS17_008]PZF55271.1 GNAT family N-acetyltransferase [Curtobacterium sp. MCSS17_008]